MKISKKSFYSLNYTELENILIENDINVKNASILFKHHYKDKNLDICHHHNLSKKTKNLIEKHFNFELPKIKKAVESLDQTVKFLIELFDTKTIEAVLIPFQGKYTLCLSSQVGCAMNCSFCFTGTQGLTRQLETHEIIGQFLLAWNWLKLHRPNGDSIKNIVFMGQGEPLHNFDVIKKSCEIFLDQHGMSLGTQKITISTAGYLPGLKRWNDEIPGVNLALSFHSPFTEKRNELIPINKKYPLQSLLDYIATIPLARKQYIIFEYLLIKDFNDSEIDATETAKLLKDYSPIINLIPFNPFPGTKYEKPTTEKVIAFQKFFQEFNLPALIRSTKGDDILAACGQLNSQFK